MRTYTIGETATRSGFSASALRYYEDIRLVEPSSRTVSGYRLYDDDSLERLAFVARAKQLGCSLEEITDLVAIRDGRQCGPVQRRFHELLTAKIRAADTRVDELVAFAGQLRSSADQLSGEPIDGPCGPECACVGAPVPPDAPIACTLEPGAMPDRVEEWRRVLAGATGRTAIAGGLRIDLAPDVDLGDVGRLLAAEQRCCAFFRFALFVDADGTVLEVTAPELAGDIVAGLFGSAAPSARC